MNDIKQRFISLLSEFTTTARPEIDEATAINGLEVDSLDYQLLIMACEEEFGLVIPDEEAAKLTTVGAAVRYLEGRQSEMSEP